MKGLTSVASVQPYGDIAVRDHDPCTNVQNHLGTGPSQPASIADAKAVKMSAVCRRASKPYRRETRAELAWPKASGFTLAVAFCGSSRGFRNVGEGVKVDEAGFQSGRGRQRKVLRIHQLQGSAQLYLPWLPTWSS